MYSIWFGDDVIRFAPASRLQCKRPTEDPWRNVQHKSTAYGLATSFRPCCGVAKSVRNFDATYHDVTPIKLDLRPHYDCVVRTQKSTSSRDLGASLAST